MKVKCFTEVNAEVKCSKRHNATVIARWPGAFLSSLFHKWRIRILAVWHILSFLATDAWKSASTVICVFRQLRTTHNFPLLLQVVSLRLYRGFTAMACVSVLSWAHFHTASNALCFNGWCEQCVCFFFFCCFKLLFGLKNKYIYYIYYSIHPLTYTQESVMGSLTSPPTRSQKGLSCSAINIGSGV